MIDKQRIRENNCYYSFSSSVPLLHWVFFQQLAWPLQLNEKRLQRLILIIESSAAQQGVAVTAAIFQSNSVILDRPRQRTGFRPASDVVCCLCFIHGGTEGAKVGPHSPIFGSMKRSVIQNTSLVSFVHNGVPEFLSRLSIENLFSQAWASSSTAQVNRHKNELNAKLGTHSVYVKLSVWLLAGFL